MITDEELKTIIDDVFKDNEDVIDNKDKIYKDQVYTIIKKIIDLPSETITTIADLINYNANETFVEPLIQEQIRGLVKEICKELNIELEENSNSFDGPAYYYQFKKINNFDFDKIMKETNKKIAELEREELAGKTEEEQKVLKEKWKKEKNVNDTINSLINKIKSLPIGTEFTISQLIDVDTDDVLSISIDTFERLEKQGIKIKSKFGDKAIMGLPQNIPYIKIDNDK